MLSFVDRCRSDWHLAGWKGVQQSKTVCIRKLARREERQMLEATKASLMELDDALSFESRVRCREHAQ